MNITIVGGGNIGTQFAVHCAEKGHHVTIYSSKPDKFDKNIKIVNENDEVIHESNDIRATNNDSKAFNEVDLIFITLPAFCIKEFSQKIYPYIHEGLMICLVPGTGGGECFFREHIKQGVIVFGLQRVPSVARLIEYGKTVRAVGYRDELFVAAIPGNQTVKCTSLIESIFDIKATSLPNYLNITLTPSNPILHTTRLNIIFQNYKTGCIYEQLPLFYEDWNDETSRLLFKCDDEVQCICSLLAAFDLSFVKSLKEHYESHTPELLTQKIRSIKGFKGLKTPALKVENGFIPDLSSRYFTADFSFGLNILIQIAELYNIDTPYMKNVMNWYLGICKEKNHFDFRDVGMISKSDFEDFYQQ